MNRKQVLEKLQDGFDFIFNDEVYAIGELLACIYCTVASLYFALPWTAEVLLPKVVWWLSFGFMLIAGVRATENFVYMDVDEELDEDDDELVED